MVSHAYETHKVGYVYPDIGDRITAKYITSVYKDIVAWAREEDAILMIFENYIKRLTRRKIFVDAGCGTGRLTLKFDKYFQKTYCVDADKSQLEVARRNLEKATSKIVLVCNFLENFTPPEPVDAVLCSHVIQHVKTHNVRKILQNFYEMLRKGGYLMLLFSKSQKNRELCEKQYEKEGRIFNEKIDKNEFNELVFNREGILPIRKFDIDNLTLLLTSIGFKIITKKSYHQYLNRVPWTLRLVTYHVAHLLPRVYRYYGRDGMILAMKV